MLQLVIVLCASVLVGLDQLTKGLAVTYLQGKEPLVLIDGFFELNFTTNSGVAFGMFSGYRWIFIAITSVTLLLLFGVLMSGKLNRYKVVTFSGTLIIAGGVGNLIDRIFRHEVVDFLYFKFINFPIFNLADCSVVVGASMLLFFFLFIYKEEKPAQSRMKTTPSNQKLVQEEGSADGDSNAEAPDGEDGGKA